MFKKAKKLYPNHGTSGSEVFTQLSVDCPPFRCVCGSDNMNGGTIASITTCPLPLSLSLSLSLSHPEQSPTHSNSYFIDATHIHHQFLTNKLFRHCILSLSNTPIHNTILQHAYTTSFASPYIHPLSLSHPNHSPLSYTLPPSKLVPPR